MYMYVYSGVDHNTSELLSPGIEKISDKTRHFRNICLLPLNAQHSSITKIKGITRLCIQPCSPSEALPLSRS